MKKGSTLFLKAVIVLIGLLVLALCIFALPKGITSDETGAYKPILIGMYVPAIPFFIALFQGMKLLNAIDTGKIFSTSAVKSLRIIKYCGFAIFALYLVAMPYIFYLADMDDAPGVALLGFIFTFAGLVVGTSAAIFQNLLKNIINVKSENELTV